MGERIDRQKDIPENIQEEVNQEMFNGQLNSFKPMSRRRFLKLSGAAAAASLYACAPQRAQEASKPTDPPVQQPAQVAPTSSEGGVVQVPSGNNETAVEPQPLPAPSPDMSPTPSSVNYPSDDTDFLPHRALDNSENEVRLIAGDTFIDYLKSRVESAGLTDCSTQFIVVKDASGANRGWGMFLQDSEGHYLVPVTNRFTAKQEFEYSCNVAETVMEKGADPLDFVVLPDCAGLGEKVEQTVWSTADGYTGICNVNKDNKILAWHNRHEDEWKVGTQFKPDGAVSVYYIPKSDQWLGKNEKNFLVAIYDKEKEEWRKERGSALDPELIAELKSNYLARENVQKRLTELTKGEQISNEEAWILLMKDLGGEYAQYTEYLNFKSYMVFNGTNNDVGESFFFKPVGEADISLVEYGGQPGEYIKTVFLVNPVQPEVVVPLALSKRNENGMWDNLFFESLERRGEYANDPKLLKPRTDGEMAYYMKDTGGIVLGEIWLYIRDESKINDFFMKLPVSALPWDMLKKGYFNRFTQDPEDNLYTPPESVRGKGFPDASYEPDLQKLVGKLDPHVDIGGFYAFGYQKY